MKHDLEHRSARLAASDVLNLAASWYVAMASEELSSAPRRLRLFGKQLVAWRDGAGRPVIMGRHCPHMGASLDLGKVVDGCLQCPFHGWRFDASGRCVSIPALQRVPATAHHAPLPVVERYGYVWAWYGSAEPMFALPDFPALEAERDDYLAVRFVDSTRGTTRRILENAYDYVHFTALHGAAVSAPLRLTLLEDPRQCSDNGPPIASEAWLGAVIEAPVASLDPVRSPLRSMRSAAIPFVRGETFRLVVDGWPGGQRFTAYLDGRILYKVLLGITPVGERETLQQQWMAVRRTGRRWKDLLYYGLFYVQNRAATAQDIPIYDTTRHDGDDIYLQHDRGVLRFREYYQAWVERATRARSTEQRAST